jgi:hydrogenase large subunit
MAQWGRDMFVTPGVVVDGKLVTNDLVDINLGSASCSAARTTTTGTRENVRRQDPLGNPVDGAHPWNQTTSPKPAKRDFEDKYTWVMSPALVRQAHERHLALDTGGGPLARLWTTALAGRVDSAT